MKSHASIGKENHHLAGKAASSLGKVEPSLGEVESSLGEEESSLAERCLELRPLLLIFQVEMTALCLSLCVILSLAFPFCFLSFFCMASYVYRVFDIQEAARSRR